MQSGNNPNSYENKLNHKFELVRSQSANDPLAGVLSGVVEQREEDGSITFCAQVDYGPYSVIIPEDKFKEGLAGKERPYVKSVMESRLGTRIYFITEQFDDKTNAAVGNSITANEVRKKYWFKKAPDGEFEMKEGREVTGDIIAIKKSNLIVNVSGVETFIPAKDATYKRVAHLGMVFTPGESIKLKLINVFRTDDSVEFIASHKIYEDNPGIKHYDKYIEGSTKIGTVTGLTILRDKDTGKPRGGFMIYVQTRDDVVVRCYPPVGIVPQEGQQMSFKLLKKKKTDSGVFMLGKGLHVFR